MLERLFHGQECYFPPQVYEELRVHEPSTPALEAGWARLAALSVEGELRTIYFKSLLEVLDAKISGKRNASHSPKNSAERSISMTETDEMSLRQKMSWL